MISLPSRPMVEKGEKDCMSLKNQRNIAFVLCAVFFALTLIFAFRSTPVASKQAASPTSTARAQAQRTDQAKNYVASVNSGKYHRLTCDYADNILEENRVYYATVQEAEAAGKQSCSVCRP